MAHTQWLNDDEMRMWLAFVGTWPLVDRQLDQQLKEDVGLSHLQYAILMWLDDAPDGEMRMTALAERLVNSKSGLTYQVDRLEQAGLVRRRVCDSSPRAVYAQLTDDGREMLDRAAPGHVEAVRELVVDVLTPEERTAIADGLGRIRDRILSSGVSACH